MSPYPKKLAPSILAGNHACLVDSLRVIELADLSWIHLDIMDGHFVPNLSFGPQTVADLRKLSSSLYFDTHLMLDNPHLYVEAFAKAGSNNITVHIEPEYPIKATLSEIKSLGCHCGIALNPDTPVEAIMNYMHLVDLVLVMTVQPGFGGQSFREDVLAKIEALANLRESNHYPFRIEVDGGINLDTGLMCKEKGCDTFVAGTAFYSESDKSKFSQLFEAPLA